MKPYAKIIVLGSGPIRIGQGVEFDYSTVHAVATLKKAGYEAIIINNNPETVSTDFTTSDKLYFEPLTIEDIMNIIDIEKPEGIIVSLGGQTPINLAEKLTKLGVKIIGTDVEAIERAENRDVFEKIMDELEILKPAGKAVTSIEEGIQVAQEIGYPVLVRPSYVLGGRAMQIVGNKKELEKYFNEHVCLGCSTRFLNIPFSSLMTFTYQYKEQDKIIVFYSKLLIQRNFRHFEIFRDQIIKTLKKQIRLIYPPNNKKIIKLRKTNI